MSEPAIDAIRSAVDAEFPEVEKLAPKDRPLLARSFEEVEVEADGRNLYLRCVPYDVPATVADEPPYGDGLPYQEEFARGAFRGALKDPGRVLLEYEHFAPGLTGVIGRAFGLEEKDDALYGHFRTLAHSDGAKALELVNDGVLRAASVFFEPITSARSANGVVRRLAVRLRRVALCMTGSYPSAEVLAVRSAVEDDEFEDDTPRIEVPRLAFDPELASRLAEQGIRVPDSLRSAD